MLKKTNSIYPLAARQTSEVTWMTLSVLWDEIGEKRNGGKKIPIFVLLFNPKNFLIRINQCSKASSDGILEKQGHSSCYV